MILIRLVTENSTAVFDNSFNEDILLKPNSKMALQSISVETKNNVIDITSANNEISFQVSTGFIRTVTLEVATYTKDNYGFLLNDIQKKLNDATGFDDPDELIRRNFGLEWKTQIVDKQNKAQIGYRIGVWAEYETYWEINNVIRLNLANKFIWRLDPSQPDYENSNSRNILLPYYISTGCSFIRCRTNNFDTEINIGRNANGYIIALSTTDLSTKKPEDILDSDITYGIQVASTPTEVRRYWTIVNGVFTIDSEIPEYQGNGDSNNDQQEISINFDQVELNVYQNSTGAAKQNLASFPYTAGQKLYPIIIFRGKNADVNGVRTLVSPYALELPISTTVTELTAPPQPRRNPSNNFLQLSPSLANFFGFDNPRIPQNGFINTVEYNYVAENPFEPTEIADAFLVELLNLKCMSYDALLQQRKNILAVIPKSNTNGELIYETNTPFFIDLNNSKEILLRNIRLRVVRPDYSPLEMKGQATIVLLVDN